MKAGDRFTFTKERQKEYEDNTGLTQTTHICTKVDGKYIYHLWKDCTGNSYITECIPVKRGIIIICQTSK